MSVMFEAGDAAALKERLDLSVSRLKELHQEGLPELKKTGKPFACFLRCLIAKALEKADPEAEGEKTAGEELSLKKETDDLSAFCPEFAPYIRLLSEETLRITHRGREEDVIRLELILQILGEIFGREEEELPLTTETFHEALYWFYSDYSEPVLTHCLKEAATMGVSFPAGYGKQLSYTPGFLEWGDLAGKETSDHLVLFDANLATRRMEAFSEALKEASEAGTAPKLEYTVQESFCEQNRNYRHFIKRLKET